MPLPKLVKNTAIYTVLSVVQKSINFLLLPFFTIYLTPSDYGVLSVVLSISTLLTVFFTLSLPGASARFHYQHLDDEKKLKVIWGTNFTAVILVSIILGTLFFLCHSFTIDLLAHDIEFYPYLALGMVNTMIAPMYAYYQTYLQTKQEGVKFGINSFLWFLLNATCMIIFIAGFKLGAKGALYASVLTNAVFVAYAFFSFVPQITLGIDRSVLRASLAYSLPLIPHSLSGWLSGVVDRLFINKMVGITSTGLYSVGYQIGSIVNLVAFGVNQAFSSWFFDREKTPEGVDKIIKVTGVFIYLYTLLAFSLSIFAKEIVWLMTSPKFIDAWKVIPILTFAGLWDSFYYFFVAVLFLEKTKYLPIITFACSFVGIIMNFALIPKIGYIGAAVSYFVVTLVTSALVLYFSLKFRRDIAFKWKRYYGLALGLFVVSLLTYWETNISFLDMLLLKLVFVLFLCAAGYVLYHDDIKILSTMMPKKVEKK